MTAKIIPLRRVEGEIPELSDEALLAACSTGDTAALGALFDRFHAAVYRVAGRFPLTDDLARDDLVQATFMEVRRVAHTYRGASSVRTWILGIAANLARRVYRGEQRRRVRQARYVELPTTSTLGVDEQVDRRQLLARIQIAVAELPHDQQVAFVLCDLEQLPCTDVARSLGVPDGTMARRLHDARKAVRAALERGTR
ncbi:MAG: RNA polymerase sigma factor [Kofleriaceae bacterium]|nr:RNA polymerase sigma factor [Kofleriaceae bacterium]